MAAVVDLTGQRNRKLVAVEPTGESKDGSRIWLCKCDCGNTVEVAAKNFWRLGSCGCLKSMPTRSLVGFNRNRVDLKKGRTFEEFILKYNEDVEYSDICEYLSISVEEARAIYDRVYNMNIEDIGRVKVPKVRDWD